jgi:hypothetical protein
MNRRILQWLGLAERPATSREADRAIEAILVFDAFRQEHGCNYSTNRFQ